MVLAAYKSLLCRWMALPLRLYEGETLGVVGGISLWQINFCACPFIGLVKASGGTVTLVEP